MKKGLFARVKNNTFEGENYIGPFSHVRGCDFGYMSYCGSSCTLINVKIGKFSSIAGNVKILFGNHPKSNWISTHPAFYSPINSHHHSFVKENLFQEYKYSDMEKKFFVEIGNDVWIASYSKILAGVRIGDGAIVASGSVVTDDVAPYMIVGGIPAKRIGQRFRDEEILFIQKHKWWEKDVKWIEKNAVFFSDFESYCSLIENYAKNKKNTPQKEK